MPSVDEARLTDIVARSESGTHLLTLGMGDSRQLKVKSAFEP